MRTLNDILDVGILQIAGNPFRIERCIVGGEMQNES